MDLEKLKDDLAEFILNSYDNELVGLAGQLLCALCPDGCIEYLEERGI